MMQQGWRFRCFLKRYWAQYDRQNMGGEGIWGRPCERNKKGGHKARLSNAMSIVT